MPLVGRRKRDSARKGRILNVGSLRVSLVFCLQAGGFPNAQQTPNPPWSLTGVTKFCPLTFRQSNYPRKSPAEPSTPRTGERMQARKESHVAGQPFHDRMPFRVIGTSIRSDSDTACGGFRGVRPRGPRDGGENRVPGGSIAKPQASGRSCQEKTDPHVASARKAHRHGVRNRPSDDVTQELTARDRLKVRVLNLTDVRQVSGIGCWKMLLLMLGIIRGAEPCPSLLDSKGAGPLCFHQPQPDLRRHRARLGHRSQRREYQHDGDRTDTPAS